MDWKEHFKSLVGALSLIAVVSLILLSIRWWLDRNNLDYTQHLTLIIEMF